VRERKLYRESDKREVLTLVERFGWARVLHVDRVGFRSGEEAEEDITDRSREGTARRGS
jgi:hypothetical protein